MCSWMKRTKQWELRIAQGLFMWLMLSRYTSNLNGSNISNLPIHRVYPIYVHYAKFKQKPIYPYAINPYLHTLVFYAYALTIVMGDCWVIEKCECEKRREKWKSGGTNFGGKMKSHLSHISRRKEIIVLILGNTSFTS